MTKDQINQAIAELRGWTEIVADPVLRGREPGGVWGKPVPNCHDDLNAMHEAEKVLTHSEIAECHAQIKSRFVPDRDRYTTRLAYDHSLYSATAAQRAEAFLRTKGAWVD